MLTKECIAVEIIYETINVYNYVSSGYSCFLEQDVMRRSKLCTALINSSFF